MHDRHDDRHQPRRHHVRRARKPIHDTHNYGVLSFTDVIVEVEQRRRDQDRLQARHRAAQPSTSRASGSASRCRRTFPARAPASSGIRRSGPRARWRRCRWAIRSASRRCRWSPRSARSPTAASTSEPRVVRAVYQDSRRYEVQPKEVRADDQPRHRGDADRRSWKAVVERGTAQAPRRFPATRSPARPARRRSWSTATTRQSDYNASFVGFVPSRNPGVAIIVVIDSPHGERLHRRRRVGAGLQAHRRGDASLSRRRAERQPAAAGAGGAPRRLRRSTSRPRAGRRAQPVVSLVADGPPGTMPDLRGMSAREAVRKLVEARHEGARVAATASSSRRIPPPGAPLDATRRAACMLERSAVAARR